MLYLSVSHQVKNVLKILEHCSLRRHFAITLKSLGFFKVNMIFKKIIGKLSIRTIAEDGIKMIDKPKRGKDSSEFHSVENVN